MKKKGRDSHAVHSSSAHTLSWRSNWVSSANTLVAMVARILVSNAQNKAMLPQPQQPLGTKSKSYSKTFVAYSVN